MILKPEFIMRAFPFFGLESMFGSIDCGDDVMYGHLLQQYNMIVDWYTDKTTQDRASSGEIDSIHPDNSC